MQFYWISLGAALGAISRWQLTVWFNALFQSIVLGTWLANIIGCLLIGIALGLNLSEDQKLLFVTGFLGSFTTFSAFSAEVVDKFLQAKWLNALALMSAHVIVGICATFFGFFLIRYFTARG